MRLNCYQPVAQQVERLQGPEADAGAHTFKGTRGTRGAGTASSIAPPAMTRGSGAKKGPLCDGLMGISGGFGS